MAENQNIFRVPTGVKDASGQEISDVFIGNEHISNPSDTRLQGVDLTTLPIGTAPEGFKSRFTPSAASLYDQGAVTTGQLPEERQSFFKDLQDRMKKTDETVSGLMALYTPSDREQELQKQVDELIGAAEQGITREEERIAPMSVVTGRQNILRQQANNKIAGLQRELQRLSGNREGQARAIEMAYNVNRNNVQDAIQFYQMTQPERIGFDQENGIVFFENPMTGEVYQQPIPGFTAKNDFVDNLRAQYPDAGIMPTDTDEQAMAKLRNSQIYLKSVERSAASSGGLTPTQLFDRELKLAKDFEGYAKDSREATRQIGIIRQAYNKAQQDMENGASINAASQGVLVAFQKLLDPTSVVRESEYSRSASGLSLLSQIEGKYAQLTQGGAGVSAKDLKEFVELGELWLQGYEDSMMGYAQRTANQAASIGADLTRVLTPDMIELLDRTTGASSGGKTDVELLQDDINTLKGTMTREQIIELAKQYYPGIDVDQIGYYVYTMIPDNYKK